MASLLSQATVSRRCLPVAPAAAAVAVRHYKKAKFKRQPPSSPLVEFQLDAREVKHMAPHVLSAAVANAGASRHSGDGLWKAYGERAVALNKRLSLRDVRLLLQGYADASIRDHALFQKLVGNLPTCGENVVSPRDLCSIAIAYAKLRFNDGVAFDQISASICPHLDTLDMIDLGSLVNAFSRAARCDRELFDAVSVRLKSCAQDSPADFSPAASALVLNAYAICSYCDVQLWQCLLTSAVIPRIAEFSVTQCALIANSLARCADALPDATATLAAFADHWSSHGTLERLDINTEDLAYLADALARVRASQYEELNKALAASSMRRLSAFNASQLAMLCGALASLPSGARAAFFAMAARHAVPDVIHACTLGESATLVSAFVQTSTAVPMKVGDLIFAAVSTQARDAASAILRERGGTDARMPSSAVSSRSLASLADGATRIPSPARGLQALRALRAPALALSDTTGLSMRAVTSMAMAHAHFRLLDETLLDRVAHEAASKLEGLSGTPLTAAKVLLASFGRLGALHSLALIGCIDSVLERAAPALRMDQAAECLLELAIVGFDRFPRSARALWSRAQELCHEEASITPLVAAQLSVSCDTWQHSPELGGDMRTGMCWDWMQDAMARRKGSMTRLDVGPPHGMMREVFRVCHNLEGVSTARSGHGSASIRVGEVVAGFHADIILTLPDADGRQLSVALELDGPERYLQGDRQLLPICRLKQQALERSCGAVIRIGFWEWPADDAHRLQLLSERLAQRNDPGDEVSVENSPAAYFAVAAIMAATSAS